MSLQLLSAHAGGACLPAKHPSSCAHRNSGTQALHAGGEFVTVLPELRAFLQALPTSGVITNDENFLLIGPAGGGHTTFARHAWRRVGSLQRPFVVANCRQIRGRRDINRLFQKARLGDLYLEEVDRLPSELVQELLLLTGFDPYIRVIGSIKTSDEVKLTNELKALLPRQVLLPALRDRACDIVPIAEQVLATYPEVTCSREAFAVLTEYSWPHEVTQLVHCLRQSAEACLRQGIREISAAHLSVYLDESERLYDYAQMLNSLNMLDLCEVSKRWGVKETLRLIEAAVIAATLKETSDCASHAASVLQVPINTLASRKKVLANHIDAFEHLLQSSEGF